MFLKTLTTFTIPLVIYSVMGLFIARIQLSQTDVKHFKWLGWLQFSVDAMRIVFLWPLVLFIEKSKSWLENTAELSDSSSGLGDTID
jgi:hypothetical protein